MWNFTQKIKTKRMERTNKPKNINELASYNSRSINYKVLEMDICLKGVLPAFAETELNFNSMIAIGGIFEKR